MLAPWLLAHDGNEYEVVSTSRQEEEYPCDLADKGAVRKLLLGTKPDIVVHAAALTDVEGCERDEEAAEVANHRTTANIASSLPADTRLIYISTDQVYPNTTGVHCEGTEAPENVYGRSKLAGEKVALTHPNSIALRTSFFGRSQTPGRHSLSDFIIDSLGANKEITIFDDILFTPLHATTLATMIFVLATSDLTGSYNLCSRNGFSKAKFALKIASHLGLQTETATVGQSTTQSGRAARALDLRMDPTKLETALGCKMPTLQQEIEKL